MDKLAETKDNRRPRHFSLRYDRFTVWWYIAPDTAGGRTQPSRPPALRVPSPSEQGNSRVMSSMNPLFAANPPPLLPATAASALGSMALGSLLGDEAARPPTGAVNPLAPQAAALRAARPRASSTCSWPAGPASSSCSTTSRSCRSCTASRSPSRSSRASGSPSWTRFTKEQPKLLGTQRKFAQHGKSGRWVSELPAAPRRRSSTTSPSSARWRPTSSTTPRPSCS